MKRALITGISGQDGSYLAEYLLDLGYEVFGIVRREPGLCKNLSRLILYPTGITYYSGDLLDQTSIISAIHRCRPTEIYNLAAQVFVPASWTTPDYTFDANINGLMNILATVQELKLDCKVYQASSSEMFGNTPGPCNEQSAMMPTSPYGVSKLAGHHLCRIFRDRGMFVCSGICFNHESPRRGQEMVTQKIANHVAHWAIGQQTKLKLGDISAKRDWGFAGDYVRAMHAMLQQDKPDDYVIGTGVSWSVEDFLNTAIIRTGLQAPADWEAKNNADMRTNEIHELIADASKARNVLAWVPQTDFPSLVSMMVNSEIERLRSIL